MRLAELQEIVTDLVMGHGLPVQRTCRAVGMGRATYHRPLVKWARRDASVIAALTAVVTALPRWGLCIGEIGSLLGELC